MVIDILIFPPKEKKIIYMIIKINGKFLDRMILILENHIKFTKIGRSKEKLLILRFPPPPRAKIQILFFSGVCLL